MATNLRALAVASAAALLLGGAQAGTVSNHALGFSAAFPCKAQQTKQTVQAAFGKIPVVSLSCGRGKGVYIISVSSYPRGFVAGRKHIYRESVNGAAGSVEGKVRRDKAYRLGVVTGRDVLIDLPKDHAAAHLRIFFAGDRQYQVSFIAPKGHENGKAAMRFLNSFRLRKLRR